MGVSYGYLSIVQGLMEKDKDNIIDLDPNEHF